MSQTTILIIDDSATIRRLVDSHLSQAGYRVILGPDAEQGLKLAAEIHPDLILLDHQLPGTTGFQVCQQLLKSPDLRQIPVVVSSTLRKRAYVEYTDLANVVDMLPKPYAPELLLTTVANALETGKMIVASQADGTAIPEVIDSQGEAALAGTFRNFALRDVLDFLNHGQQRGTLEVEGERRRTFFHLADGRIQGVTAAGVDPQEVAADLPATLADLKAILNFTVGGRFCAEVDGLADLLDKKVLDPRLLKKLLRSQAACLTRKAFHSELKNFRFEAEAAAPPLYRKLPLDLSLTALLVDGALASPEADLPPDRPGTVYVRKALRGQNLDRAGLSAPHMKLVGALADGASLDTLARQTGLDRDEARRVLYGLSLAALVESQVRRVSQMVIALEADPHGAKELRALLTDPASGFTGQVVRDRLGLQLLLNRNRPEVLLWSLDAPEAIHLAAEIRRAHGTALAATKWIGLLPAGAEASEFSAVLPDFDHFLTRPYTAADLQSELTSICDSEPVAAA